MNYFHKKIWIAWRKLQFLMLPPDRRVRLEVSQDGRQWTFLLVSLYEAGYGVHVYGHSSLFRELILLRKSAPIPFIVGGGERECGILISDRKGDASHSPHILLDYDYFSGLQQRVEPRINTDKYIYASPSLDKPSGAAFSNPSTSELAQNSENTSLIRSADGPAEALIAPLDLSLKVEVRNLESDGGSHGDTANTGSGDKQGNHGLQAFTRIEAEEAGRRLASQAGAEFLNSFTSELSRNCKNTSPTRSASSPASSAEKPRADIGGLISDKSEVAKSLDSGRSAIDSDCRPNAGHSLKEWSGVFEGLSPSLLGSMPSKTPPARAPGVPALASSSVLIREIRGQNASSPATSYSPLVTPPEAVRMPYFMHPSVYHKGLHRKVRSECERGRKRRFRIGFFGTHDPEFYSKHYHFPGMNRTEILNAFSSKFTDQIKIIEGSLESWPDANIVVSIDERGGDRVGKSFLSQADYFEAMRECDFVLSPPGWCMPISHNLIEAMFCGAIPITNAGNYMVPALRDGVDYLAFEDGEGLASLIKRTQAMDVGEVEFMRQAVREYYERFLEPKKVAENFIRAKAGKILVNAEENSIRLVFLGMVFPWDVPAEVRGGESGGRIKETLNHE